MPISIQELKEMSQKDYISLLERSEGPFDLYNRPFDGPAGKKEYVVSPSYKRVTVEPDWIILTFSEEQDKKGLYNMFYNNGWRVPVEYKPNEKLTIYKNTPKKEEFIEAPDVIIDKDVVEINTKQNYNVKPITDVIEQYISQKSKLVPRQ